jgi:exosortase/archaeosortase family protein
MGMWNHPTARFIFWATITYTAGVLVYDLYLLPHTQLDELIIHLLVHISEWILSACGFQLLPHTQEWWNTIHINGSNGVWISSNCDGFSLLWVFSAVFIFLKGDWRKKLIYLPIACLMIEGVNVLRIVSLAMIELYSPKSLAFNHDYTFTILVYAVVVGLWYYWITHQASPSNK